MNKPNLLQQIEFIAGARKVVTDQDGIVELNAENGEMLKAIEENLITLRNEEYAAEKKQTNMMFDQRVSPMSRLINYEAMKIKIELTFRLLQTISNEMQHEQLPVGLIESELSKIGSLSIGLIYHHKLDDMIEMNSNQSANAHAFGVLVFDAFMNLQKKIANECNGLPITLSIGKKELIIRKGMDDLMDLIKKMHNG